MRAVRGPAAGKEISLQSVMDAALSHSDVPCVWAQVRQVVVGAGGLVLLDFSARASESQGDKSCAWMSLESLRGEIRCRTLCSSAGQVTEVERTRGEDKGEERRKRKQQRRRRQKR